MKKQQPTSLTIKCQCSVYKHGLLVTSKKKSKLSSLELNYQSKTISIKPFNSKDEPIVFQLKRLKHVHRKFVTEGKMTLQFTQEIDKSSSAYKANGQQNNLQRLSQILVEAASCENLQLLIKKIVQLKKEISQKQSIPTGVILATKKSGAIIDKKQRLTEDELVMNNRTTALQKKRLSQYPIIQKFSQGLKQRKKDPLKYSQHLKQFQQEQRKKQSKLSRKQLMKQALMPTESSQKPLNFLQNMKVVRRQVDILQLPTILLQKVFQYTKINLKHRLISRKFDSFVLKNTMELKLHDEIDELTFNKLAKYAINIRGRLKNVRSVELIDLHDGRQLQRNCAKSLYFGEWKEMSKHSIQQIKGLRVYLLQMPYQIKFGFDALYGIRLKQLHLISRTQVTTQNSLISDENLIYLFKHVNQLEAFSIPYINSIVLQELTTKLKHKAAQLKMLKIGSVNENCKGEQSWWIMHVYQKLQKLEVQKVLKGGIWKSQARYAFTFPQNLNQLTLGSVASQQTITCLPTTITKLKLTGDNYYNNDIADIYLPYLRVLDLSESTRVRPSVIDLIEKCTKVKMITNWEKQDIDFWKQMATEKNIEVVTIKGTIIRR